MKSKSRIIFWSVLIAFFGAVIGNRYLEAFPTVPKPAAQNGNTVSWDVKQSNPYVQKGKDGEIMLNLKVKGQEIKSSMVRPPVNLVLVIDRSGSMGDARKLDYAKEAANRIISGLASTDRLGIVAYSTDVETLYPIQFLKNKQIAISVVDSLTPTDSTNLSGGLIAGVEQLRSLRKEGYINRVILLSDGLANVGITDMRELNRIASGAGEGGVHITTMGLGLDYDENLMMNLAEHGAGNYYFIESPTQLAKIFEKEFGQMLATVAKNTTVYISLAEGVALKNVYGYTYTVKDGKVQINLGDVFSGQERNILIGLTAPTDKLGKRQLASVALEYTDVIKNNQLAKVENKLAYEVTEDANKVTANEDKDIAARGASVNAAYDMYQATEEYQKGNRAGAYDSAQKALSKIIQLNNSPQKSAATVKQEAELRQVVESMSAANAPAPESDAGKSIIKEYKAKAREAQK